MKYNFDQTIERHNTGSEKWDKYGPEVLPLWVADMDFPAPEAVIRALQAKVRHGIFGYERLTDELREAVAGRMLNLYGWRFSAESVVATPGVISGFNAAARTACAPGEGILVQPPVYPPFLTVHEKNGLIRQDALLARTVDGNILKYAVDFDRFREALNSAGARTGMFLLCSPHNPTGQVVPRTDLVRMAELCLENGTMICSDEIHSELLLDDARHVPVAALSPEIAERTITLVAPSKTFNVPGLFGAFAIITNHELLERYKKTVEGMTLHVNSLGLAAAQAAFSGACDDWLAQLRRYLTANRDFLADFIARELPGIRTTLPQATYLAWLDCNDLVKDGRIAGSPHKFFLERAKVALNEGAEFGPGGEGFVRLNFGCPRAILAEALERMKTALEKGRAG